MRVLTVRLNDYSARRAILMAVKKIPSHFGTAHLAKADMMIGRHSAPLVMNLPLWFGKGQPEQARLSSMTDKSKAERETKSCIVAIANLLIITWLLCHRNAFQKSLFSF
jgi:hypothetical protein